MSDDKLGRLAEINRQQMDQALRDMDNLRRTDNTFNRSPFIKQANQSFKKPTHLKVNTKKLDSANNQQSLSHLQVDMQISDNHFL